MTFAELARITGKHPRTITQAFHRKRLSIKRPEDVKSYLHLTLRPRQVRRRQPTRDAPHLRAHQFQPRHRAAPELAALIAHPRRMGAPTGVTPTRQALLATLARAFFSGSLAALGIVFAGEFTTHPDGRTLAVLGVYLNRRSHVGAVAAARYTLSQLAEQHGVALVFTALTIDALPARIATDAIFRATFASDRVEYGWVSVV